MKMRDLQSGDVFKVIRIINATGAVKAFKKALNEKMDNNQENKQIDELEVGMDIMAEVAEHILENLDKAEKPINSLLADLTGTHYSDIEKLPMGEYVALIIEFFKKPDLVGFIESVKPLIR